MEIERIKSAVESVLFVSGEPMKISKISRIIEVSKEDAENALMLLAGDYSSQKRGIAILRKEDEVQMATSPDNAEYVDRVVKSDLRKRFLMRLLKSFLLLLIADRFPEWRSRR